MRWTRRHDARYHRNKHRKHAAINVAHVILGGVVVVIVLLCCCGGIFA